jgi:hypothetical protein
MGEIKDNIHVKMMEDTIDFCEENNIKLDGFLGGKR